MDASCLINWLPIGPLSHACSLSRSGLGPSRAEVGLGSRLVGCVRRFCPPSPPLVGFWPVVCPLFLFPCPFRVCPSRARCVGVGVFSFPFPFCVPPLVFRLRNCHLIFIVISFPFHSLIFTFISYVGALNASRQRGVCVEHLNRCKTSTLKNFCHFWTLVECIFPLGTFVSARI